MMIQEFAALTGFHPTRDLYEAIEKAYYQFDGDKAAFCAAYKENLSGIAEAIANAVNARRWETDQQTERKLNGLAADIRNLERQLEREQEWKPYLVERAVKQERYDHIRKAGREMTDQEAIEWIAQEFGFDAGKIKINRLMNTYEVNRHHQLRKVGEIDRRPMYDATDWYYVFFTVAG